MPVHQFLGGDHHRVGLGVAVVAVELLVVAGGLVLQPLGELLEAFLRVDGQVDGLVVADGGGEAAEVAEDRFTAAAAVRLPVGGDVLLTQPDGLQKAEEHPLQRDGVPGP